MDPPHDHAKLGGGVPGESARSDLPFQFAWLHAWSKISYARWSHRRRRREKNEGKSCSINGSIGSQSFLPQACLLVS